MNDRTKFLMASMGLVFAALLGDAGYRKFVEEPTAARERELSRINKQIKQAEDAIFESADAADRLAAIEQYSLPYDVELARSRYQDWLLVLVKQCELEAPRVDPGNPTPVSIRNRRTRKPQEIYHRYGFSVRGRGSLHQITRFLYEFYRAGHLHKISSVALNPVAGGTQLDVTVAIEALGLTRCERESELSGESIDRLAYSDLNDYQSVVYRNVFASDGDEPLKSSRLTAVTFDVNGQAGAWYSQGDDRPSRVLGRGESLEVSGHRIEIVDIQPRLVLIDIDGTVTRMSIGMSLQEALVSSARVAETKAADR